LVDDDGFRDGGEFVQEQVGTKRGRGRCWGKTRKKEQERPLQFMNIGTRSTPLRAKRSREATKKGEGRAILNRGEGGVPLMNGIFCRKEKREGGGEKVRSSVPAHSRKKKGAE